MITHAAVKLIKSSDHTEIILRCHRHGDVLDTLQKLGFSPGEYKPVEYGFISRQKVGTGEFEYEDKFVDRQLAYALAVKSGQVVPLSDIPRCIDKYPELFSEDLW